MFGIAYKQDTTEPYTPGRYDTTEKEQEKAMAKLTATEKETIILFNEKEDTVEVYTYNGKIKRNIEKA